MLIFYEETSLNDQYKNYLCQKIASAPCSGNPTVVSYLFLDSNTYKQSGKSHSGRNSSVWDKNKGIWLGGGGAYSFSCGIFPFLSPLLWLCVTVLVTCLVLSIDEDFDSSMFQPIHRLPLIQFLQITLLLVTYMDLDTCSAVSSSAYPALDTSLARTYHIYLALLPSLWFFQGLLDTPPEEAITNNSIPTLNFSWILVITHLMESIEFKIFTVENG